MDVTRSEVVPASLRLLSDGSPVTGATVVLDIQRTGDNLVVDWSDNTLKAIGSVVQRYRAVAQVSATDWPGLYRTPVDLGAIIGLATSGDTLVVTLYKQTAGPTYTPLDDDEWRVVVASATATDVTNAVIAIEDYGSTHWTTATGFAVPGDAMNLANDAITAAKIANGAIGVTAAPLLAHLDADVSSRLATSGYGAPPSAAANAAAVWATVESTGVDGTMGGSLWKTRRRLTQRASTSVLGVVTLYEDDNVTPETTFTLTDVDGNAVTIVAGDPARRSAET